MYPRLLSLSLIFATVTLLSAQTSWVIPYRETGAKESPDFTVKVNGQKIFVADHSGEIVDDNGNGTGKFNSFAYAHFAFAGKVDVELSVPGNASAFTLSPKSCNIHETRNGSAIRFSLTVPRKLLLWTPSNETGKKLAIFADPPEENPPKPDSPKVFNTEKYGNSPQKAINAASNETIVYLPAGQYAGAIRMKSNLSLYLAPGAVIKGELQAENLKNIRVYGRGVVMGHVLPEGAQDVFIEDVIVINGSIEVLYTENAYVYNVKSMIVNARFQTLDGNGSNHLTVDNVFFWSSDDATAIGYRHNQKNVIVRNSVLGTWMSGSTMKIHGSYRPGQDSPMYSFIGDYTYENLDCLISERFVSIFQDCGGNIENIFVKNIRVEKLLGDKLFDIAYATWTPDRNKYGYGQMRGFYIQNASVANPARIVLYGLNDAHPISDVFIDNVSAAGQLFTNASQVEADNVENLRFARHDPVFVTIEATDLYAEAGKAGTFTFHRSGPTTAALTIPILVWGTAKPGVDYQSLAATVTFSAGQSETKIQVEPLRSPASGEIKTILVSIANQPLQTKWSVGKEYHAMMNLTASGSGTAIGYPIESVILPTIRTAVSMTMYDLLGRRIGDPPAKGSNHVLFGFSKHIPARKTIRIR